MIKQLCMAGSLMLATGAYAASDLDGFMNLMNSQENFSADFTQSTLSSDGTELDRVQGHVTVQRPDQFVWESLAPAEQEIVSDGKTIWIYDKDLDQVTVQPAAERIQDSPAVILSGRSEQIASLYQVSLISEHGKNRSYRLIPEGDQSSLNSIEVRFRDNKVSELTFDDSLGQKTLVELQDVKTNQALKSGMFRFQVPEGVDVLEQAQ